MLIIIRKVAGGEAAAQKHLNQFCVLWIKKIRFLSSFFLFYHQIQSESAKCECIIFKTRTTPVKEEKSDRPARTIGIGPFPHCQWKFRIYEAWILQLVRCNMIIRIPGLGRATRAHLQIDYTRVYVRIYVCRGRVPHSFYFLACIMHVEASLHCQWRIGKVPPISDRRHFSGRDVCRRFSKNVLTRAIVPERKGEREGGWFSENFAKILYAIDAQPFIHLGENICG